MVAIIALATISPVGAQADNTVLEMHQQNNIPYVSGGIGDDEKAELEATQANYNFRVINADKAGHFFGNTRIVVSDMKGNVLLDTTSGPLFYANLPKGKYSVESYSNEQVKKKIVTIAEGKSAQIRFMWSEEMNDEATR